MWELFSPDSLDWNISRKEKRDRKKKMPQNVSIIVMTNRMNAECSNLGPRVLNDKISISNETYLLWSMKRDWICCFNSKLDLRFAMNRDPYYIGIQRNRRNKWCSSKFASFCNSGQNERLNEVCNKTGIVTDWGNSV